MALADNHIFCIESVEIKPGKVHHNVYLMPEWEQMLRALLAFARSNKGNDGGLKQDYGSNKQHHPGTPNP